VLPTAAALRLRFSELISDDLPTLGNPAGRAMLRYTMLRYKVKSMSRCSEEHIVRIRYYRDKP